MPDSVLPSVTDETASRAVPCQGSSRLGPLHLWVAVVAVASQALSPPMASVGQACLMLVALVRAIDDRRFGVADPTPIAIVRRRPAVMLGLGLVGWAILAIAWSPDTVEGLARLRPIRAALFVAALLPVTDRPLLLVLGAAVGASIEAAIQILMVTDVIPDPHNPPWSVSGGLSAHPGNVGLWSGAAALLLAGAMPRTSVRGRSRAVMGGLVLACLAGLLLTGNRSLLVGLPIAFVVLVGTWMWRSDWRRRIQLAAGGGLLLAGIALIPTLDTGLPFLERLRGLAAELSPGPAETEGKTLDTSGGLRIFWWREAVPIVAAAPYIGHGSGSTRVVYDAHIDELDPSMVPARARTDNAHSTVVHALVETGVIGGLLGLAFVFTVLSDGLRSTRIEPLLEGLPAAWTLLAVYAVGNTVQLSPYPLFLLCTLTALSIGPVVRGIRGASGLTAT